jgi:hypothetical protein
LNPPERFLDNEAARGRPIAIAREAREESERARARGAAWPRRVIVSLWVLAFAIAGGVLAARWDALMARLAGPPAAAAGGAFR